MILKIVSPKNVDCLQELGFKTSFFLRYRCNSLAKTTSVSAEPVVTLGHMDLALRDVPVVGGRELVAVC
jgi:hypothetical protein